MQARKVKKLKPLCKDFKKAGKCSEACAQRAETAHGEFCKASLTV